MAKESENQMDFQNNIADLDEVDMQENKLNPQFYIHNAILKVQNAYDGVTVSEGVMRFILAVEQLESLLIARGVSDKYTKDYEEKTKDLVKDDSVFVGSIKRSDIQKSQIKFKLLLDEVFSMVKVAKHLKFG